MLYELTAMEEWPQTFKAHQRKMKDERYDRDPEYLNTKNRTSTIIYRHYDFYVIKNLCTYHDC